MKETRDFSVGTVCPNRQLPAQSRQQIHFINVRNRFQANNKDTRTMSGYVVLISFLLILNRFNTQISPFVVTLNMKLLVELVRHINVGSW